MRRCEVAKILDIDMDFFLDAIAHLVNEENRLDDKDYIPWSESQFRNFIETNCNLSKENPIKGRIVRNHNEAFHFWDELIDKKELVTPFEVTHIDAHSDLGMGDGGWAYICGDLTTHRVTDRRANLDMEKVYEGNYLAYAAACGWLQKINFVPNEKWDNDLMNIHFKDCDAESETIQIKNFPKDVEYRGAIGGEVEPLSIDDEIPFVIIPWKEYNTQQIYDYVVFCQSPRYTPKSADYMLKIIKEYIQEI